jgi:hypothetical protein
MSNNNHDRFIFHNVSLMPLKETKDKQKEEKKMNCYG